MTIFIISKLVYLSSHRAIRYLTHQNLYAKLSMMNQVICDAIRNRCVLTFTYDGHPRVVEPHAYGLSRARREVIRCYQTGGTSRYHKVPDWKLMRVDRIKSLIVTKEHFVDERIGYMRGDKGMSTIFCEL